MSFYKRIQYEILSDYSTDCWRCWRWKSDTVDIPIEHGIFNGQCLTSMNRGIHPPPLRRKGPKRRGQTGVKFGLKRSKELCSIRLDAFVTHGPVFVERWLLRTLVGGADPAGYHNLLLLLLLLWSFYYHRLFLF